LFVIEAIEESAYVAFSFQVVRFELHELAER
jgi:hypothetical protein